MTANDTAIRIVLAVGLFPGSDSHIYTLARDRGQAIASAAPLPLAGDGLIAAASSAMLVASRQGRDVPVLARVMLLAGIGATIAANVGYGLHAGITGALLSVWPVAAYVGCMELLTWMRRNTGMHPAARPASTDAAADPPDELARRRHTETGGLKRSLANLVKQDIGQLTALVKTRLRRVQYQPGLLEASWPSPGLTSGPFSNFHKRRSLGKPNVG